MLLWHALWSEWPIIIIVTLILGSIHSDKFSLIIGCSGSWLMVGWQLMTLHVQYDVQLTTHPTRMHPIIPCIPVPPRHSIPHASQYPPHTVPQCQLDVVVGSLTWTRATTWRMSDGR